MLFGMVVCGTVSDQARIHAVASWDWIEEASRLHSLIHFAQHVFICYGAGNTWSVEAETQIAAHVTASMRCASSFRLLRTAVLNLKI
jgi:hypothetical protein